jgi:uncharacterized integral membrane protein
MPPASPRVGRRTVPGSRAGGLWVAAIAFALVLLLLMVFILQNGQAAHVYFLGAHGELPMGVALLLAAIFGVLLVALPGTVRIVQLRLISRRHPAIVEPQVRQPSPSTDMTSSSPPVVAPSSPPDQPPAATS